MAELIMAYFDLKIYFKNLNHVGFLVILCDFILLIYLEKTKIQKNII